MDIRHTWYVCSVVLLALFSMQPMYMGGRSKGRAVGRSVDFLFLKPVTAVAAAVVLVSSHSKIYVWQGFGVAGRVRSFSSNRTGDGRTHALSSSACNRPMRAQARHGIMLLAVGRAIVLGEGGGQSMGDNGSNEHFIFCHSHVIAMTIPFFCYRRR